MLSLGTSRFDRGAVGGAVKHVKTAPRFDLNYANCLFTPVIAIL